MEGRLRLRTDPDDWAEFLEQKKKFPNLTWDVFAHGGISGYQQHRKTMENFLHSGTVTPRRVTHPPTFLKLKGGKRRSSKKSKRSKRTQRKRSSKKRKRTSRKMKRKSKH